MSEKPTAPERVQAAYRQLASVATDLNSASDELGKVVSELDAVLQQLNLGISAWVKITGDEDPDGSYWSRGIGYTQVGGQWGIALRDVSGNANYDETHSEELWLFNNAPRWMRIESVSKIPDLLERLSKQTSETAELIKKKTAEAKELTAAINAANAEAKPGAFNLNVMKAALAAASKTAPRK